MELVSLKQNLKTDWLGKTLEFWPVIDSTNQRLKDLLKGPLVPAHGMAVVADQQSSGRGRLGRTWWSPPGQGLYTSFLLYPPKDKMAAVLSLLAGMAVARAVEGCGLTPQLKWPNDVLLGDKKCAGILVEAGFVPRPWAVVGIGLNVNGPPTSDLPQATTLAYAAGQEIDRGALWCSLANWMEHYYEQWQDTGSGAMLQEWSSHSATLGTWITVLSGATSWSGYAESVDEDGALWVRAQDGTRRRVLSGEVSIRTAQGRYI